MDTLEILRRSLNSQIEDLIQPAPVRASMLARIENQLRAETTIKLFGLSRYDEFHFKETEL